MDDLELGVESVLEKIPILVIGIDEKFQVVAWNNECERITGYSKEDAEGDLEAILSLLISNPDQLKNIVKILQNFEEHFENWEIEFKAKSGERKIVSWSRVPISSNPKDKRSWVAGIDVTHRAEVENSLKSSVKTLSDFQTALNAVSIVAITDKKGIIIYSNDNFCKISGYSKEELLGQTHRIVNSGYHTKEFFTELWKTISKGKIWKGEIKNKTKEGRYYWVDTTISPILDTKGKPIQYLAIRNDITERKEAEEKARQAENNLKTLQDRMSPHFLFNTLSIIHSYLETNSALADSAILMLAENYRFLIDNANKELVPFDIEWQFMENYVNLLKLRFQDFMDVEIKKEGDFAGCLVPPLILQPLVENSYIHGIRDKEGKGKIWIYARTLGGRTEIKIRDNGSGFKDGNNKSRTLVNIAERLKYFLSDAELRAEDHPEGGAMVTVLFSKPRNVNVLVKD
ncbi:histidine kinase [Leptospira perolatii]|uniref:Histidine kinase n=1 Tax=Leptospira perolatii TaxID=2023191 RepID=A0A2M9ZQE1_9LEPT|nr:PAS domain S-box protein [Leptospira perolatii]PJZ70450.1 histidine kinase [Leptospira perolatii]PJZ74286.1 histidine kinase [Leptospira perolatii]